MAAVAVAAILSAGSFGLLSPPAFIVLDDSAQLASALFATVCCALMARRTQVVERSWRRLMALAMAGWSVGQLTSSSYQILKRQQLPSPAWADVGYVAFPVFGLVVLLIIGAASAAERRRQAPAIGSVARFQLVLVLDGLVVVGSLLILTWSTTLGRLVQARAPTRLAFDVALANPIIDLILVVIVLLLLAARPLRRRLRPQLALLGLGLVGLSVSDSIFTYLVASGADRMPPIADAGFIAGPVFVALAALTVGDRDTPRLRRTPRRGTEVAHLLLPYLPLFAAGLFILCQAITVRGPYQIEVYLGVGVVALVVARQMITLIDNNVLLGRIYDAHDKLRYQAYHDQLTGLANRTLFLSRITAAVELNRTEGQPVALLYVDLDDFKAVNDNLGHSVGDRVLQAVGERLRSCVRSVDMVSRLGGDEFGILFAGGADQHPDYAEHVGQRILATLRQPFDIDGRSVVISASVGAAMVDGTEPGLTAETLVRRADSAMYAGKRRGKGRLIPYGLDTDDDFEKVHRLAWERPP